MSSNLSSSEIKDLSVVPNRRQFFDLSDEMDGAEIIFSVTEGTLRYTVKNISKMKTPQYSSVWVIRNLLWKIMVHPVSSGGLKNQSTESLGFFLQCDTKDLSNSWGCDAVVELRLLSNKEGEKPFTRRIQHFYYSLESDWGFTHFIPWKDLLDPENGYIQDNSITVEAHVVTGEPIEIDLEKLKLLEDSVTQRRESLSTSDGDSSNRKDDSDSSIDTIKPVKKKSIGKLRYTVKNLARLKKCEYSPPFNINNLSWHIVVKPNIRSEEKNQQEKYVGVYVKCDGPENSSPWLVYASVYMRVIPVKEDVDAFDEVFSHYFTCEEVTCGISYFLPIDFLLNPENGFITENGSVTFESHMFLDKCQGITLDSRRFFSEVDPNECNAESEVVYKFKVDHISTLEESRLSPTFKLHGLSWSIIISPEVIYRHCDEPIETLGFFLRCQGLPLLKNWCCYAAAELRLLSNKPDQQPFLRRIYHIFNNVKKTWGFKEFLPWKQVLAPENGYTVNDSITAEIHVLAEPPYISKMKRYNNKLPLKLLNVIDEDESSIPTPGRQEEKLIINNLFSFTCNDPKNKSDEQMPEVDFQFIVQNVSQLSEVLYSPQIVVSNLLWRMKIVPRIRESILQAEMLAFFLECGPITETSKPWCCYANATLRLLSCQKDKPNLSTKIQHLFNPKDASSGCIEFIRWDDLLDHENGFIENDTVTFEIDLIADPPYDINSSKKSSNSDTS
ncbi:GSCOCG00000045001-RA-CDS [Cotesia congregata]|nr:GSCOCG00000045001-RA-CDS [Cotesia congregata]